MFDYLLQNKVIYQIVDFSFISVPFIIVELLNSLPCVRVICVQFNMAFLPLQYTTSTIKLIKNVPFSKVVLTNVGLKRLQVCMNAVEHVCVLQSLL
jgi:hypothetical protein